MYDQVRYVISLQQVATNHITCTNLYNSYCFTLDLIKKCSDKNDSYLTV